MGEPKTLDDAVVKEVGKVLEVDAGQVFVSWGVQWETVVLPKSVTARRIQGNFRDKILPDLAMDRLNALVSHKRFNFPGHWGIDMFDEIGEKQAKKNAREAAAANMKKFPQKTT